MVAGAGYAECYTEPERYWLDLRTAIGQLPLLTAWYAFPGEQGLKITDVIMDRLQTVVAQSAPADQVLRKMAEDVQALLPK